MKVFFMNNGDFDVRAMLTMGVSAKSENAIGFFGTGFKYAIAIILRLGGSVEISTLSGVYKFESRKEVIRDKEFDIVYMNDREAGFTTHLGANWEPWMAFRELYCNAKDEGGLISDQFSSGYDTTVSVDCPEIHRCYASKSDYFLTCKPIYSGSECDIHKGGKPFIYYRGIAVKNADPDQLYSYNITRSVDLTEDRTAKHDYQIVWPIQKAIQTMPDKAMLRTILRGGDHAEAKMGFDKDWGISEEFAEVARELMKTDSGCCESARRLIKSVDEKAGNWPEFKINDVQQKMLDRAISVLARLDIDVNRYPVKCVVGLGDNVMGRALDETIYLSEIPFQLGTKQLASTLMEEWVHCKHGCADFDRKMQNWLFDKIFSLSETITGEPI